MARSIPARLSRGNHFLARQCEISCGRVMLAREATLSVFDFETTGVVEDFAAEPWQFGIVEMRGGIIVAESQSAGFMRVGERPFSPHAPGTWMQHLDEIAAAPSRVDWWPHFEQRLHCDAIVAHSVGTEKKILRHIAPLHRHGPWIDTLKLSRLAFPDWKSHALEDAIPKLGLLASVREICPGRAPHDALFDAVAAAVLLEHLLTLDGWHDATVEALAAARPRAYHAQRRIGRARL